MSIKVNIQRRPSEEIPAASIEQWMKTFDVELTQRQRDTLLLLWKTNQSIAIRDALEAEEKTLREMAKNIAAFIFKHLRQDNYVSSVNQRDIESFIACCIQCYKEFK